MNIRYEDVLARVSKLSNKECWDLCPPLQRVKVVIYCNSQKTIEEKLKMIKELKLFPKRFYRKLGARAARLFEKKAALCYIEKQHLKF